MRINKVTITGADDDIEHTWLHVLTEKYSFVEWGILFSKSRQGQHRYPTDKCINKFLSLDNLSAHFCGWWAKEILENKDFDLITHLSSSFKRVQLNYNFQKSTGWNLEPLIKYAQNNPNRAIVLQYNKSNSWPLNYLMGSHLPENLHFLYDSSGGRGTHIKEVAKPFDNYTGYSGGINIENIESIIGSISNFGDATYDDRNVWIDMESGVRVDDKFNLFLAEDILTISSKYIKP